MARVRQTNQQKAGKQNTSKSLSGYYGNSSGKDSKSKAKKMPKKRTKSYGY